MSARSSDAEQKDTPGAPDWLPSTPEEGDRDADAVADKSDFLASTPNGEAGDSLYYST